jgi:hypothetical protein
MSRRRCHLVCTATNQQQRNTQILQLADAIITDRQYMDAYPSMEQLIDQ